MKKVNLESLFSLKGKTVVVTGGASGIGRSVAGCMAGAGADIVIFDISLEAAQAVAQEIADCYKNKTAAFYCDVTDPTQVCQALAEAETLTGHLDVLVNNAGIGLHKSCLDLSPEDWLRVNNVNYNGMFYMATEFARRLIAANRPGSIINTGSMSARIVNVPQRQIAYNSSKAGVVHMTRSLAVELAEYNIRVNAVSPGYIYTELTKKRPQELRDEWVARTPQKRLGVPEDLGSAYIYLACDSAPYTTGCELVVDGGYTIV